MNCLTVNVINAYTILSNSIKVLYQGLKIHRTLVHAGSIPAPGTRKNKLGAGDSLPIAGTLFL